MAKKKFEQELAALDLLRGGAENSAAVEGLRKALTHRVNYLVRKAAQIVGEQGLSELIPDLLSAMDRFYIDCTDSDPQCWAKIGIAQTLARLGYDDPEVFARGLRHVQMEAVWGGCEDTAGPLRAQCAAALVECRSIRDMELLSLLVEALVDSDKTVRMEAARAIGRVNRPEAALLLRLRALSGDGEPEVLGACFTALLSIEGGGGIDFVVRFLERESGVAGEAALALGFMRDPRAFDVLRQRWAREREASLSAVLLTAIAIMQLPEAIEFLVHLCETAPALTAKAALEALASARISPETRLHLESIAKDNPTLAAPFEKHFNA